MDDLVDGGVYTREIDIWGLVTNGRRRGGL
jgi:hypothetical protein